MSTILPIPEDDRIRTYTASAGQTAFTIPFPFQRSADIAVSKNGTALNLGSQFSVTGAGLVGGGTATLTAPCVGGETIVLMGDAEMTRSTSVANQGRFASRLTDDELDRSLIRDQEIRRDLKDLYDKALREVAGKWDGEGKEAHQFAPSTALSGLITYAQLAAVLTLLGAAGTITNKVYDSILALEAATVDPAVTTVVVNGNLAGGDGGTTVFTKIGTVAPSPLKAYHRKSFNNIWWKADTKIVNIVAGCGADPTNVADSNKAFFDACALGNCIVKVPDGDYKISNILQITLAPGTILWGEGKPRLHLDVGAYLGAGRNGFVMSSDTAIENFHMFPDNTGFMAVPDGNFHGAICAGVARGGPGFVDVKKRNMVCRNIDITSESISNAFNAKAIHGYGWVENIVVDNCHVLGGFFGIPVVWHWGADFGPLNEAGYATKSWHPAWITVVNSSVTTAQEDVNGLRFSGCAFVTVRNFRTTAFDPVEYFYGDQGGRNAQNIKPEDVGAGIVFDTIVVERSGGTNYGLSIGALGNTGQAFDDIARGNDYRKNTWATVSNCTMIIDDLIDDGDGDGPSSEPFVFSFFNKITVENSTGRNTNPLANVFAYQFNNVNHVEMRGCDGGCRNGARFRSAKTVAMIDCNLRCDPPNYDTTSNGISLESHTFTATLAEALSIGGTNLVFTSLSDTISPGCTIVSGSTVLEATGAAGNSDNIDAWVNGASYIKQQDVLVSNVRYVALSAHVASPATEPGIGASWATVWVVAPNNCNVAIKASPIALAAGTVVTIEQTVRSFVMTGGSLEGFRQNIATDGDVFFPHIAISGVRIADFGFRGIQLLKSSATIIGCTFTRGGQTANSTDTRSISADANCKNVIVANNTFERDNLVKFNVYFDAGAERCAANDNLFLGLHPATAGAAHIFNPAVAAAKRPNQTRGNRFADPRHAAYSPTNVAQGHYQGENFIFTYTALPGSGTWLRADNGDTRTPTAAASPGNVCVTSGTAGTLAGVTGSITNGTFALVVNTLAGIELGCFLAVVGLDATLRQVLAIDPATLTVTLSAAANATVAAAAVSYSAPVWKAKAALAA